jgi:hypothetical protein
MTVTHDGETLVFFPAADLSISDSALSSGHFGRTVNEKLLAYRLAMRDFMESHEVFEKSGFDSRERRNRHGRAVAALSMAKSVCELITEDCTVEN